MIPEHYLYTLHCGWHNMCPSSDKRKALEDVCYKIEVVETVKQVKPGNDIWLKSLVYDTLKRVRFLL